MTFKHAVADTDGGMPTASTVILVVEDNPAEVRLIQEGLGAGEKGCELRVATNGEEGLRFLRRSPPFEEAPEPDLVLLDLNLPRVHGHDLLKEVKEDPELCEIPVVVFSSSDTPEDVEKSYRLHANTFVTKPPDFHRYVQALQELEDYWLGLAHLSTRCGGSASRRDPRFPAGA